MKNRKHIKSLTEKISENLRSNKGDSYYCTFVAGVLADRCSVYIHLGNEKNAVMAGLVGIVFLYGAYNYYPREEILHHKG